MKQAIKSKSKEVQKKVKMSEQHKPAPVKEEAKTEPVKKPQAPAVSEGNIKAGIVIS